MATQSSGSLSNGLCHIHEEVQPASLQRLPAEIVAQIFSYIVDLQTLDSFIRATSKAYHVFESRAVEITESVLSSGYVCGHIRVLFRIIALLRSGTLPVSNLAEFRERVIVDSMQYASRVRSSRNGFAPERLAENTKPSVLRGLLATSRNITFFSLKCLAFYVGRFRTLQPQHPKNRKLKLDLIDFNAATWQSRSEGTNVETKDVGPPSWTEEQRVLRPFWRLQLLFDLKRAARRGLLGWSEEDTTKLSTIAAVTPPLKRQSLSLERQTWDLSCPDFYHALAHMEPFEPADSGPPEYEELLCSVAYIRDDYGQGISELLAKGELCLAWPGESLEVKREWPLAKPGEKDWKSLVYSSTGVGHHGFWMMSPSLLCQQGFGSMERYGFAFWSGERLQAYGLYPNTQSPYEEYRAFYAWEGIVSAELGKQSTV